MVLMLFNTITVRDDVFVYYFDYKLCPHVLEHLPIQVMEPMRVFTAALGLDLGSKGHVSSVILVCVVMRYYPRYLF